MVSLAARCHTRYDHDMIVAVDWLAEWIGSAPVDVLRDHDANGAALRP